MSQKKKFEASTDHLGDFYLTCDGKPVVYLAQLPGIVAAVHTAGGCRAKTNLANEVSGRFYLGRYYSSELAAAVKAFKCKICSLQKQLPKKSHDGRITSWEILDRIQIDATTIATTSSKLTGSHGFKYVLTAIDCLSKKGWAFATKTLKPEEIVPFLVRIFDAHGVPNILQTDNGGQFVNDVIAWLTRMMGFRHLKSAPRTPQSQGQVERFNQTFKRRLFSWIRSHRGDDTRETWHTLGIKAVLLDYNSSYHTTIGCEPNTLFHSRLSTPTLRKTAVDDRKALFRFVRNDDARFPLAVSADIRALQENNQTHHVVKFLEQRKSLLRRVESKTTQTQIWNHMR